MTFRLRTLGISAVLCAISACSTVSNIGDSVSGLVGGSEMLVAEPAAPKAPKAQYGATVRIGQFEDRRKGLDANQLGMLHTRVIGLNNNRLLLDRTVVATVAASVKQQFAEAGYQVLDGNAAAQAMFEVSGSIDTLSLDIGDRDTIEIQLAIRLNETASGKTAWSGSTREKNDRFAGVGGNNREDVLKYFNYNLNLVGGRAVQAVTNTLMAQHPELFGASAGSRAIHGVQEDIAATAPTFPRAAVAVPSETVQSAVPALPQVQVSANTGLLSLNTVPARAKVYINGVYYALTPARIELDPGIYDLAVKLDGYRMVSEQVSVRKGANTEMELDLVH